MSFSAVVLAAGQGTRMCSERPKVLHELGGKPMLRHVLQTVAELQPVQTIVVCGHKGQELLETHQDLAVEWVWQHQQLGTGHAVQCAQPALNDATDRVLVVYGDVPLITTSTLQKLLDATPANAVGVLTTIMPDPSGLGRILRDKKNRVIGIVEDQDATSAQQAITEINSGIYVFPAQHLAHWLENLQSNNQQQELYLTDLIAMAVAAKVTVVTHITDDQYEVMGVNSQRQLAQLERIYQLRQADQLMDQGAKLIDPSRLDVRGTVTVGKDVTIDANVIFAGDVELGDGVSIGPNVLIKDSKLAAGTTVYANSVIEGATTAENCQIGPFARIRSGSKFGAHAKVGNFVEIKQANVGAYSKINHLSYIGDSEIGKRVNIGAGVITCNYDGAKKHKTIIEDDVFIGSNCELIAPVTVGEGATLGAGTTLTRDAPAQALTLSKKILTNIAGWCRPAKQQEESQ